MASDNKDDTKTGENKGSTTDKVADSTVSRSAEEKVPPLLSDAVSSTASNASTSPSTSPSTAGAEAKSEAKPKPDSGAKPKAKPDTKPDTKPDKKPTAAAAQQKKSGGAIGWLALLIALLALAGVGYALWTLQQDKDSKTVEQARFSESQAQLVNSFKASTQVLSDQVQGFINKSDSQQQRVNELQIQLQATSRQIGEVTQVSRRSWMLAEAEYLLRLANQRLLMERETASALTLLSSADQILVTVAEPGLFEVRKQLAREMVDLRAVAKLDVEGIFVTLAALGNQVETLALLTPENEPSATDSASEVAAQTSEGEAGGVFTAALEHFSGMVTVRQRDEPLAPLLTPEQHFYVQQNLRLMLEQTQLALLQRKPGIYSRSLGKAEGWVQEYFQLNANSQALLASLQELQQVNVAPQLPDISASLGLLKAYLAQPAAGAKLADKPGDAAGAAQ